MIKSGNGLGRFLCAVVALLSTGCATLFHSSAQTVAVNAWESEKGEPVAARVMVNTPSSAYSAVTPFIVGASPSLFHSLTLAVDDPCYDKFEYGVDTSIAPIYFLNIFTLPAFGIGFGIDFLTGSMFDYESRVTLPVQPRNDAKDCLARPAPVALSPAAQEIAVKRKPKFDLGFALGSVDSRSKDFNPLFSWSADFNYFVVPQLTLGVQLSGAGGDVTDYNYSSVYGMPVQVSQSSALVTAHYFLRDYSGFYVGLAAGRRSLDVTVQSTYPRDVGEKHGYVFLPLSPGGTASLEYVPLLLQAGWRMGGRASIGIDLAAPVSRLGLGNPHPINETSTLKNIGDPETRQRALQAFREYRQPFEIHVRAAMSF